jgi:hypothetical protein
MSQENDNKNDKKLGDSRWWEFYFVRYFVGTAIGAIVILFLIASDGPGVSNQGALAGVLKTLKPDQFDSGYMWLIVGLGLAYCYVASSPVLVLHATRGSLFSVRRKVNWKSLLGFLSFVFIFSGIQICSFFRDLLGKGNPWQMQDFYFGATVLALITFIFAGQLFLLGLSLFGHETDTFDYYDKLTKKRAAASPAGQEYIESYRHLREHGNAFFIVLFELLLGAALFYSPVSWGVIIMLWIAPAAGVWFLGTFLENRKF